MPCTTSSFTETQSVCRYPGTSWKFGTPPAARIDRARRWRRARAASRPGASSRTRRGEGRGGRAARRPASSGARPASCRSSDGTRHGRLRRRRGRAGGTRPRSASAAKMRAVTSSTVPSAVDSMSRPRLAVHVDERRGLALVDVLAVADGLFGVVGAALLDRRACAGGATTRPASAHELGCTASSASPRSARSSSRSATWSAVRG